MHHILMVFLDGVGIGKKDFESNPFFKYGFNSFENIFGEIPSLDNPVIIKNNNYLFPSDANLGVEGLPQSGTGQVSLFCGINAAKIAGKHFGPYPFSTTIPVLKEQNILVYFRDKFTSYFANAYPKLFFDYMKSGRSRLSASTLTCKLNGIRLNTVTDVREGRAITSELTNERWNVRLGYNLPVIKPKSAARRLLKIAHRYKFTLFEYYLSDHIGHLRMAKDFKKIFFEMDEFLYTLLSDLNRKNFTLIICSDHGNLEDLSTKTHTRNPSLTIAAGKNAEKLYAEITDITRVKSAIIKNCR